MAPGPTIDEKRASFEALSAELGLVRQLQHGGDFWIGQQFSHAGVLQFAFSDQAFDLAGLAVDALHVAVHCNQFLFQFFGLGGDVFPDIDQNSRRREQDTQVLFNCRRLTLVVRTLDALWQLRALADRDDDGVLGRDDQFVADVPGELNHDVAHVGHWLEHGHGPSDGGFLQAQLQLLLVGHIVFDLLLDLGAAGVQIGLVAGHEHVDDVVERDVGVDLEAIQDCYIVGAHDVSFSSVVCQI